MTAIVTVTRADLEARHEQISDQVMAELRRAAEATGAKTDGLLMITFSPLEDANADPVRFCARFGAPNVADIVGGLHDGDRQVIVPETETLRIENNPHGGGAFGKSGTSEYRRAGINDATGNWAFIPV